MLFMALPYHYVAVLQTRATRCRVMCMAALWLCGMWLTGASGTVEAGFIPSMGLAADHHPAGPGSMAGTTPVRPSADDQRDRDESDDLPLPCLAPSTGPGDGGCGAGTDGSSGVSGSVSCGFVTNPAQLPKLLKSGWLALRNQRLGTPPPPWEMLDPPKPA